MSVAIYVRKGKVVTGRLPGGVGYIGYVVGEVIPPGELSADDTEKLLKAGVISYTPPSVRPQAPEPNPSGVGIQGGAQLDLNAQGPRH